MPGVNGLFSGFFVISVISSALSKFPNPSMVVGPLKRWSGVILWSMSWKGGVAPVSLSGGRLVVFFLAPRSVGTAFLSTSSLGGLVSFMSAGKAASVSSVLN